MDLDKQLEDFERRICYMTNEGYQVEGRLVSLDGDSRLEMIMCKFLVDEVRNRLYSKPAASAWECWDDNRAGIAVLGLKFSQNASRAG